LSRDSFQDVDITESELILFPELREQREQRNRSSTNMLDATVKSLELLLENNSLQDLDKVSASRLHELFSHINSSTTLLDTNTNALPTAVDSISSKTSVHLAHEKHGQDGTQGADSVQTMFPRIPDREGLVLVRPDTDKVELLQHAVYCLHAKIKEREMEKFYKIHFLLRTAVVPGVYSDIYTK
jgi:hypothetical protein